MAAGCLLITEAGGLVGDLEGNETQLESGQIIAGNPKIFGQLLQVIAPHLTPALIEMRRNWKISVTGFFRFFKNQVLILVAGFNPGFHLFQWWKFF